MGLDIRAQGGKGLRWCSLHVSGKTPAPAGFSAEKSAVLCVCVCLVMHEKFAFPDFPVNEYMGEEKEFTDLPRCQALL